MEKKNWIADAIKKKGALHKALHVSEDKKIPEKKLSVKENDSTKMKRRKILAETLANMHK